MLDSFHFVSFLRIFEVKVKNCVRDRFSTVPVSKCLRGFDLKVKDFFLGFGERFCPARTSRSLIL